VRWKERNFNADAYVTFALNPDGSIERMKMAPVSTISATTSGSEPGPVKPKEGARSKAGIEAPP
jgi:hypothetical protein